MGEVLQLSPHVNMTAKECLSYCYRNSDEYQDVIVVGYDEDGAITIRSSSMNRADACFMLMRAIDQAKSD